MPLPSLRMIREDEPSAFSCHNCLQAIPNHRPLFFMNDRIFCSSTCRFESAARGGPVLEDHVGTGSGPKDRVRKRSMSRVSASLDAVGEEACGRKDGTASPVDGATDGAADGPTGEASERATRGGSFFAYLGQLGSWLSADAFV